MALVETNVTLTNDDGLHARPAGILAKTAAQFTSKIELCAHGETKNAKSIMSIMSLGLKTGDVITLKADGDDATPAIAAIQQLFLNKFEVTQ